MIFYFLITVEGEVEAESEEEARMQINATLSNLGSVDIEELECQDCNKEEDEQF